MYRNAIQIWKEDHYLAAIIKKTYKRLLIGCLPYATTVLGISEASKKNMRLAYASKKFRKQDSYITHI